ncbi:uncharacterized protein LOC121377418 [Gigantopelta aegis]|uniref:uncharacterized protein LOC121377418 n=1 Tax=Gigantopelta aegis TaxID=1735272 RepID=UPI001B88C4F2|nr:uncharacterized protein LOC121377418 [Gigantopelta aegis]
MVITSESKILTLGVVLAAVGLLMSYLKRRCGPDDAEDSDNIRKQMHDGGSAPSTSASTSSSASASFRSRLGQPKKTNLTRHGPDRQRKAARSLVDTLRRIHYYERRVSALNSAEQTIIYLDLAMADDLSIQLCNEDPDVVNNYGTDIDREATMREIDWDTARKILKRLQSENKIVPEAIDVFDQWLKTLSLPEDPSPPVADDSDVKIFMVWYQERRSKNHGQWLEPPCDFTRISHLLEHPSVLNGLTHSRGLIWLTTSQMDCVKCYDEQRQADTQCGEQRQADTQCGEQTPTVSGVESVAIGDHPHEALVQRVSFFTPPPSTDDPFFLEQLRTMVPLEDPSQVYTMDWVGSEGVSEDLSLPYVSPLTSRDRFSPSVVRLWAPVFRSAQRAEYHVTRIGTRFENLWESRFRFIYNVNLSNTPVPGTYSYFHPV